MDLWSRGWCSSRGFMVACISYNSREGVSGAGAGSGDETENREEVGVGGLIEEDECTVCSVLGRAGESEYIVASDSTSSEILSSSETGIGDDGVGSFTRIALWLSKFNPDTINLPVAHIQDEFAIIDSLSSSFIALIMNIDYSSKSCNNGDEGPIREKNIKVRRVIGGTCFREYHLGENMSHETLIDTKLSKYEFASDASSNFLNRFVMRVVREREIDVEFFDESRVHLFFDGQEWPPPHQRKYLKNCEPGFFVEELEVDFTRRTDAFVLDVAFETGFCCFVEEQFWLLRDFSGRCGCFPLNYSFGCHVQRVRN
ncbi:uncharacterized protein G2W53_040883 [Senna tora]|uniref:Uncharacterized protein n=1 Tax=Senna tora TaxID=362788 RepID=A0A834VYA8_9FABA|nr:uncharacterized protein G2W53_040883 [Senna tora]